MEEEGRRAMKYAAFIVSAIFPALSFAYRVMTDHRVKGEPPVNTRIIKRTNYRARARAIPKNYIDGVGNHLLRAFSAMMHF